jgi:hypothetical protein
MQAGARGYDAEEKRTEFWREIKEKQEKHLYK